MNIKMMTIGIASLAIVGCSSPATPEDIKAAVQKCPEVKSSISYALRDCFRLACRDPSPLTKRELRGFVNDCQEKAEIKADTSSPENVVKAQRAALAVDHVELVPPGSVELNDSDEDAAP